MKSQIETIIINVRWFNLIERYSIYELELLRDSGIRGDTHLLLLRWVLVNSGSKGMYQIRIHTQQSMLGRFNLQPDGSWQSKNSRLIPKSNDFQQCKLAYKYAMEQNNKVKELICIYQGEQLGIQAEAGCASGRKKRKVYECSVHGKTAARRVTVPGSRRPDLSVTTCFGCPDFAIDKKPEKTEDISEVN